MLFTIPLVIYCNLYLSTPAEWLVIIGTMSLVAWMGCWRIQQSLVAIFFIIIAYFFLSMSIQSFKENVALMAPFMGKQTVVVRIHKHKGGQSYLVKVVEPTPIKGQFWLLSTTNGSTLNPGEVWRMTVTIKPIRSSVNRGSLSQERRLLTDWVTAKAHCVELNEIVSSHLTVELIRQHCLDTLAKQIAHWKYHGMMLAVLFGDKSKVSPDIKDMFVNLGISHLLAVSGLHVGIWLFWVKCVLEHVFRAKNNAYCIAMMSTCIYACLSGFLPPIVRVVSCLLINYYYQAYIGYITWASVTWLAMSVCLLYCPFLVFDSGFSLSYLATFLIIYVTNFSPMNQSSWYVYCRLQLFFFIGLLPINLIFFGQYSLVSLLVNVVMIPWASIWLIPMTIASGLCVLMPCDQLIDATQCLFEHSWGVTMMCLSFVHQHTPRFISMFEQNTANLVIVTLVMWRLMVPGTISCPKRGVFVLLFWMFKQSGLPDDTWRMTLLDVGQGLSVVIQTSQGLIVFDTGPQTSKTSSVQTTLLPYLRYLGQSKIDLLIISHGDNDHSGGLEPLLRHMQIGEFVSGEPERLHIDYRVNPCHHGMKWDFGAVSVEVLSPMDITASQANNRSCVVRIHDGKRQVLLTGDITTSIESELVDRYQSSLRSDVVVMPHHGSYGSSSIRFIQATRPKIALASAGFMNRWNHPHPDVISRYQAFDSDVLSTTTCGMIQLQFDESGIQTQCLRHDLLFPDIYPNDG